MNKTQVKYYVQDLKLKARDEVCNHAHKMEQEYLMKVKDSWLKDPQHIKARALIRELRPIIKQISEETHRDIVKHSAVMTSLSSYLDNRLSEDAEDIDFYANVRMDSCSDLHTNKRKILNEINAEFKNIQTNLKSMTAKQGVAYLKTLGIEVPKDLDSTGKPNLPMVAVNKDTIDKIKHLWLGDKS